MKSTEVNSDGHKSEKDLYEEVKYRVDREALELNFKDAKELLAKASDLKDKLEALDKREDSLKERALIIEKREAEVVESERRNKNVEDNIRNNLLAEYVKQRDVIRYVTEHIYVNMSALFDKVLNAKSGKDCMGLKVRWINGRKKQTDETVMVDADWQEECKAIIDNILIALRKAPTIGKATDNFKTEDGDYNFEQEKENEGEENENAEEVIGTGTNQDGQD